MAGVIGWLLRRRLRSRWTSMAPLAAVVALGSTAAFVAIGTAQRSREAYPRYLREAQVNDLVINPSLVTADIDQVIRGLPGVRAVSTDSLFLASVGDPSAAEGSTSDDDYYVQVRGSTDDRYIAMDRPALLSGRPPTGTSEALIDTEYARARDIHLGDVLPVAFYNQRDLLGEVATVPPPIRVERLRVVGIGTLPDEVLPDGLYPRQRVIVSADIARRYTCGPTALPPAGTSPEEIIRTLLPDGCAQSFLYYSLDIGGNDADVNAAQAAFLAEATDLNSKLPEIPGAGGYFLIGTTTAQDRARVERSMQPTTSALAVLGLAAAAVTMVLAGLSMARDLRRQQDELRQWWQLGLTRQERARVAVGLPVVAIVLGVGVGLVGAWLISPVGPIGSVRSVTPRPGHALPSQAWLVAAVLVVLLALLAVVLTLRAAARVRPAEAEVTGGNRVTRLWRTTTRPAISVGLLGAFGGRRAALVVVSTGIASAFLVGTVLFGASLSTLLSNPTSYGWPWDIGAMSNSGYGPLDLDAVTADLGDRDDVREWTALGFSSAETLAGKQVFTIIAAGGGTTAFPVVTGRAPVGRDEVAVGLRTAHDLHLRVGDTVALAGDDVEPRQVTVAGIVVLPALGPFQADRGGPGTGLLLPAAAVDPNALATYMAFVGLDLVPGVSPHAALERLSGDVAKWETIQGPDIPPARALSAPVRPPEIFNAQAVRSVPFLAGVLLAVATIVGLGFALVVSVRARGRELATLRALGFTPAQLRRSVTLQAVATMVAALVLAIPLGLVLGRVAWSTFATQLGVAGDPSIPSIALVVLAVLALVLAAVASVPAQVVAVRQRGPVHQD